MKAKSKTPKRHGKPELPETESVADFKARIAAMMPRETPEEKRQRRPVVRDKGHSGFYPKPQMNDDPTKPTP